MAVTPKMFAESALNWYKVMGRPVPYSAKPYLEAMLSIDDWHGMYFHDTAQDVCMRALDNLSGWRGEDAREWKTAFKYSMNTLYGTKYRI